MLASVIQRRVPIGSRVTFFCKDERTITGILIEIARDHLTIEDDQRQVTVLLQTITGWEIPTNGNGTSASPKFVPSAGAESSSATPADQSDLAARTIIVEVTARFQAQSETAAIRIRDADFSGDLDVSTDREAATIWDRVRNRYKYAEKVNELSGKFGRIQPLILDLGALAGRYPISPKIHAHLAYLYTLVHDERAGAHYRIAAVASQGARNWYNLAAASVPTEPELACCALERFFRLTRATGDVPAWSAYVRLVHRFSAYRALTGYLRVPQRGFSEAEIKLLIETGIYFLNVVEGERAALPVTSRWLAGESPTDLALQAFQQIDRPPSQRYRQASTDLDSAIKDRAASIRTVTLSSAHSRLPPKPDSRQSSRGLMRPENTGAQPTRFGLPQWEQLYREAALAHTEGRVEDARKLFRQAIDAGGGPEVYEALFKMEQARDRRRARTVIQEAIQKFPKTVSLFVLYGHRERALRQYDTAAKVFRHGIGQHPDNAQLRMGLAQSLVELGTEAGLREAGQIFGALEHEGKLHKRDGLYQRFRMLQRSPRVTRAFDFFRAAEMNTGITQRNPALNITDIVIDVEHAELTESFGLSGSFLVRCFHSQPHSVHLKHLTEYLHTRGPQDELVLQSGRRVVLNSSLAFIAVPNSNSVHDQVMRILSDNQAAVVPLDDAFLQSRDDPVQSIQEVLARYLGRRDLYDSTQPVSGRRFYGRERLLVQLADALHSGQFLGIYGLRKIGKTSLVYQLRDEQLRHDAVAYVDLQASVALSTGNCAPLCWEVERALHSRLSGTNRELADLLTLGKEERFSSLPEGGAHAQVTFAEDLRAFLEVIATDRAGAINRLVILLDELERILPVAGQRGVDGYLEFFGLLRGLAQTERYRGLLSCVVVAANAAISERGYWEGRENPVFALYKPFFIPPLPQNECDAMIRSLGKGMSVYWDRDATAAVFSETGGHPFLTRILCSYIARQQDRRPLQVTRRMVDNHILPFIRDQGNMMEQITELLKTHFPDEASVLQQIALDQEPEGTSDETLRHLLSYHLIAPAQNGYRITLNLLHRWLRRRAGLRA
ncbi:MAG: ATP-binding protein [Spirochaetaceae bacterium]|nr:ATP-binding protein [Spirochaetaceae bacterium]